MLLTLITETRVFLVRAGFRSHSLNMTIAALDRRDLIKPTPKVLKFDIVLSWKSASSITAPRIHDKFNIAAHWLC